MSADHLVDFTAAMSSANQTVSWMSQHLALNLNFTEVDVGPSAWAAGVGSAVMLAFFVEGVAICVSVCPSVHSHISKTTRPNFTKSCQQVGLLPAWVFISLWRQSNAVFFHFCYSAPSRRTEYCSFESLCVCLSASISPELHIMWIVTSSSECHIWTHTD